MLKVGLTGGIGSGKSEVARRLAGYGALIIDADRIAREVVEPGTPGLAQVVGQFGAAVLASDGTLDRAALGEIVFTDAELRGKLNAIIHPLVGARIRELEQGADQDAIVVEDIPLIAENDMAGFFDLVVVVDVPPRIQEERLIRERELTRDQVAARMAAQASRETGWGDIGSDIGPHDTLDEIVKKIAHADARAVEETAAQLDAATLGQVVEAVVRARRIDIYGIGASAFVALDLQQKLHRIERIVYAWPDPHSAVTSAALLRRGDVAIGISHTGTTADTVGSLAEARSRGATTVAITNFPRSSITRVADHVLTTAARETTFRSGAMASRIAALTVVDCLFVAVAQRNYKQTLRALERTYAAVQARR